MKLEGYADAFIAVAGWQYERKLGRVGGVWVDVAQEAQKYGMWY